MVYISGFICACVRACVSLHAALKYHTMFQVVNFFTEATCIHKTIFICGFINWVVITDLICFPLNFFFEMNPLPRRRSHTHEAHLTTTLLHVPGSLTHSRIPCISHYIYVTFFFNLTLILCGYVWSWPDSNLDVPGSLTHSVTPCLSHSIYVTFFFNQPLILCGYVWSSPDSGLVAPGHHVLQVLLWAAPRLKFVADRLVPLPPWSSWVSDYTVLIGRRYLQVGTSC